MGIKQFLAYLQRSDDSETLVAALGNELGDWRESLSQLLDVEDEQGSRFSRRSSRSTKTGNDPLLSHKSAPRLTVRTYSAF